MSGRLVGAGFRAMGCDCFAGATAGAGDGRRAARALAAARAEVAACERALSRFLTDSDLSRANRGAGGWVAVGDRMAGATRAALAARRATGGRYDPTVLAPLVAAGYDRSFELLEHRAPRDPGGWRPGAEVEVEAGRIRVADGAAIDLGGIAKGWSAGRAVAAMREAWPAMPGGLVDLGGDLALQGRTPENGPWRIAVADPRAPGRHLATLFLEGGGVATSGRDRRRFGPGRSLHHIIDPATGRPARKGPLAVTAVASEPGRAEAFATLIAVGGPDAAVEAVAAHADLSALVVPDTGPPSLLGPVRVAWDGAMGLAS
ncbi:MAG TPA: FAD:protein FMN transferase [Miltoncostaea sp.]|nr:FAD:protein FMN transferase [Miltoncostaea sp.]